MLSTGVLVDHLLDVGPVHVDDPLEPRLGRLAALLDIGLLQDIEPLVLNVFDELSTALARRGADLSWHTLHYLMKPRPNRVIISNYSFLIIGI